MNTPIAPSKYAEAKLAAHKAEEKFYEKRFPDQVKAFKQSIKNNVSKNYV